MGMRIEGRHIPHTVPMSKSGEGIKGDIRRVCSPRSSKVVQFGQAGHKSAKLARACKWCNIYDPRRWVFIIMYSFDWLQTSQRGYSRCLMATNDVPVAALQAVGNVKIKSVRVPGASSKL